jgi:hypothetical protein
MDDRPAPANAFDRQFLDRVAARDQPATAAEADLSGPWKIEIAPDGSFAVLRGWESLAAGDRPRLTAAEREDALYAAAALPGAGRGDLYRLRSEPDEEGGFTLERGTTPVARCAFFDHEVVAGMHVLRATGRSPEALASFLEAVGHAPLEHAGRILAGRLGADLAGGGGDGVASGR